MATQTSRAKRLIKLLERILKKDYLYDKEQLKLIREQLKVAKNELAKIEEQTSKGFKRTYHLLVSLQMQKNIWHIVLV